MLIILYVLKQIWFLSILKSFHFSHSLYWIPNDDMRIWLYDPYFFFFNSSNLRFKSSKSISSELDPGPDDGWLVLVLLLWGTEGRIKSDGTDGKSGNSGKWLGWVGTLDRGWGVGAFGCRGYKKKQHSLNIIETFVASHPTNKMVHFTPDSCDSVVSQRANRPNSSSGLLVQIIKSIHRGFTTSISRQDL